MNIFDFRGPDFMQFYLTLLGIAVAVACWMRWHFRSPDDEPSQKTLDSLDPYDIAYLSTGKDSAVDAAVASLVHRKVLTADPKTRQIATATDLVPKDLTELERSVFECGDTPQWSMTIYDIRKRLTPFDTRIETKLHRLGLVLDDHSLFRSRTVPCLILLLVLLIGGIKLVIGIVGDRPIEKLGAACGMTYLLSMIFAPIPPFRSRHGARALKRLRKDNGTLRYRSRRRVANLSASDVTMSMALFGTGVLGIEGLTDLRRAMQLDD